MITFRNLGKHGEFGNQLFQIAAVIGAATKNNTVFSFPKWRGLMSGTEYSTYFKNPIPESVNINDHFDVYVEPTFFYNEIPYQINQKLDLFGFFQSEKYFLHCKNEIINFYQPSDSILKNIKNLNYKNTVSLQLRFYDNTRQYSNHIIMNDPSYGDLYYTVE